MAGQMWGIIGVLLGGAIGFFFDRLQKGAAYKNRDEILQQANRDAENLLKSKELEAKEILLKRREEIDNELNIGKDKLRKEESQLDKKETLITDQNRAIQQKEQLLEIQQNKLNNRVKAVEAKESELDRILKNEQEQLYKISSLGKDEAKELLLTRLDRELKNEAGALILKHRQKVKEEAEQEAREIVVMTVQRYASEYTSDATVSTVDIPDDEMKGRIIGREGRNIRAFEKETGVDVVVDDTPGVVIISSFDKVRREVARIALTKLVEDGRIHPSRIEEVVKETQEEMEKRIRQLGQEACQEANIVGLHEKIVDLMGRLHFRTSYTQNIRRHSIEVAFLTGMLAEQLGLDADLARRCGFLHDIGKAADHEMEGGHPAVGAELLKRYNEGEEVVHAALGHHDDIRVEHVYTVLVAAADAISASRPGARHESLERYVKRLEELEALACGFPGVNQAYAIQAGREVRVIVDSKQINDNEAAKISRDIAKAIEESLTYPGEIRVTVLRESRSVEYAK
ncbi:Ribonuclease Y [hydrothermal vent metagenome]|uniref:Ribonuclease Y n=1 Tax=hydrothermal vent metagenome TaxID=652676 RepID=A0A3B1DDV1_9ZZZZ